MAFRLAKPAHLVDINEVAGLDKLASDGKVLSIGACVRHAAFHKPVVANPLGQLLSAVARHIAHYPIRMRGTFCGSLAHADPASEWCLVAVTLDATLIARSARGERAIPAKDFFAGIMSTALAEDELLAEVRLPLLFDDTKFGFNEFSRRAGDFAMSAALVDLSIAGRQDSDARVGVGGAEARHAAFAEAEAALKARRPTTRRSGPQRKLPPRRSSRSRTIRPMPNIGAILFAPSSAALWSKLPHERARHQRLRHDLGRPRHPAARRPRADYRPGTFHR